MDQVQIDLRIADQRKTFNLLKASEQTLIARNKNPDFPSITHFTVVEGAQLFICGEIAPIGGYDAEICIRVSQTGGKPLSEGQFPVCAVKKEAGYSEPRFLDSMLR